MSQLPNRYSQLVDLAMQNHLSLRRREGGPDFNLKGFVQQGPGGQLEACFAGGVALETLGQTDVRRIGFDDSIKLQAISSTAFNLYSHARSRLEWLPAPALMDHLYGVLASASSMQLPPRDIFNTIIRRYEGAWTEDTILNRLGAVKSLIADMERAENDYLAPPKSSHVYVSLDEIEELEPLVYVNREVEEVVSGSLFGGRFDV